jgi:hypothetical protein
MNESIEHSKIVVGLDIQLNELAKAQVLLENRQETLGIVDRELLKLQDELASWPADQPVTSQTYWKIQSLVSRAADWNAGWDAALEAAPAPGLLPADFTFWLDRILTLIDQDLADLPLVIQSGEQKRLEIEASYKDETEQSRALAATLEIEKPANLTPQLERVRPSGVMILIGAFLGLCVWAGWLISRLGRESER